MSKTLSVGKEKGQDRIDGSISLNIVSLTHISIITFRFPEDKRYKKLTSRIPETGNQGVKELYFKNSGFRKTEKAPLD